MRRAPIVMDTNLDGYASERSTSARVSSNRSICSTAAAIRPSICAFDGGDVVEIGGAQFGALRRFDHAAVADERHPFGPETRRRLAQLRGERLDVRRVAGEQLDRQRASVGVAQQAITI
jgi:hypothetical protein